MKGYPDFFGFSMFPYYGPLLDETDTKICSVGASTELFTISTKGVLFSGGIRISGIDQDDGWYVSFYIDGTLVETCNPHDWCAGTGLLIGESIMEVDRISYEDTMCILKVREGVSFGESFAAYCAVDAGGVQLTVQHKIKYFQIKT